MVEDESGRPLGQVIVGLADGTIQDLSEDNGNFSLDLTKRERNSGTARIHATKKGYKPYDGTVVLPESQFVILLRRQ